VISRFSRAPARAGMSGVDTRRTPETRR
jgi:hypothetical protein